MSVRYWSATRRRAMRWKCCCATRACTPCGATACRTGSGRISLKLLRALRLADHALLHRHRDPPRRHRSVHRLLHRSRRWAW
ncbi:MAG: hypothetical protein MZV64_00125 [Ignavibacteriales bacterium]|nr:hypothetical protein [Ignavibacteriales bacterium]